MFEPADIDLGALSTFELGGLLSAVLAEQTRRKIIDTAETRANAAATEYLDAAGIQNGDEWIAPAGAHDAYPPHRLAAHNGKMWESLTTANIWEPGVSGWREVSVDGAPPPEWLAPTGAHDAYRIGERVSFDGKVYTSIIAGNVHSPTDYPAGWELEVIDPDPDPATPLEWVQPTGAHNTYNVDDQVLFEGKVYVSLIEANSYSPTAYPPGWALVPGPEPEPEPEPPAPTVPDFVQPTGAHNAYAIGTKVTFEGKIYESLIASNTYSPSAYPAGWKLV